MSSVILLQWFSSSDGKGHVYYFEENSNESSWTLPEVAASQSPQQVGHLHVLLRITFPPLFQRSNAFKAS